MKLGDAALCLILVCAVAAMGRAQFGGPLTRPDAVVSDRYDSPDASPITVRGICDPIAMPMRCWDADGRPNGDLAKEVSSAFMSRSTTGGAPPDIQFKFRRKNRIVVFQAPAPGTTDNHPVRLGGFFNPENTYLPPVGAARPSPAGSNCQYIAVDAARYAPTTSIWARLDSQSSSAIQIPLKVGSSGYDGGRHVSISSIKPGSKYSAFAYNPQGNKIWDVVLTGTGFGTASRVQLAVSAMTSEGRSISRVSAAGRPETDRPTKAGRSPSERNIYAPPNITFLSSPYRPDLGGWIWACGIDPKYVSTIRVSFMTFRYVEFKDLPLDPKGRN